MTKNIAVAKALTWVLQEEIDQAENNVLEWSFSDAKKVVTDLSVLVSHLEELDPNADGLVKLNQRMDALKSELRLHKGYKSPTQEALENSPVKIAIEEGFKPIKMMSGFALSKPMANADGRWIIAFGGGVEPTSNVDAADWNVSACVNDKNGIERYSVVGELATLQQVLDHYQSIPLPTANGRDRGNVIANWSDLGVELNPGMKP